MCDDPPQRIFFKLRRLLQIIDDEATGSDKVLKSVDRVRVANKAIRCLV